MASSSTVIAARLNSALVEAQLGRLARNYMNISHVSAAGSADHQYLWQLSQILKLSGMHNNPVWAHPSGSLSSISTDQLLQPDALRWLHSSSQKQINPGFVSGQKHDSTEHNEFSQQSLLFSDLEKESEGKNLPISTDHGNEHRTASSLIEDLPSAFDTEITDWNSMPILMPSSNPDKNDHLYYSDKRSRSTTSTNSYNGGSDILENTIQCPQDDRFGSTIRTSEVLWLPAARTDLQEDESNYWANLLNSIEDSTPDLNYISLPLPSQ